MWEPYLRATLPAPKEEDRVQLEALAGSSLPPGYWELVMAHQDEALDHDLVQDPGFEAFILLLVLPPERLEKANASYSVASVVEQIMPLYPARLLPFTDDTGGNFWTFDYRANPAVPSIVFINHELKGEEGVTAVALDFASLLARIGLTSR